MPNKCLKSSRDEFLKAVSNFNSSNSLASFVISNKNVSDTFNLSETLQTLNKKQHENTWTSLLSSTQGILRELEGGTGGANIDKESPSLPALFSKLHSVVSIVHAAVITLERIHPSLKEITFILHTLLISLPQSNREITDIIAKICIHWWKSDMTDKQRFYPNLISYLLIKSQLAKGSTVQLIKEIYSVRKGLLEMDLSEEQCVFMKPFFLKLFASRYQLLKHKECSKFLAFLFTIHPSFNLEFHLAILEVVPTAEKKVTELYGGVYFHAWKLSSGVCREKLEYACIQDLLYKGVLAHRTGHNAIFNTVFLLVSIFFSNKQLTGVDEMLYRLFKPFLWRFLSSSNPLVRTNASIFFFSAFPIQDPNMPRQELDETLQKQFDIILDLIMDPSPQVRNISITSTFKLISTFWDFLPAHVRKSLLTKLVSDLAFDANSTAVRVSVVNGLARLLENNQSHQTLETLLPYLCNHIHDNSEQVRTALVDLLIKVKHLNTRISFWNIVPVEHLLARIELDSSPLVLKIVALLMSSFLPVEKSGDIQLTQVFTMLSNSSLIVARKFYSYVHCYLTPVQIVTFINLIAVSLKKGINKQVDTENMNILSNQTADISNNLADMCINQNNINTSLSQSFIDNPTMIQGLLEITVCVWFSALDTLTQSEHQEMYAMLVHKVSQVIPLFFNTFTEPQTRSAVLLLASLIPPNKIPVLSYNPIEMLSVYTMDSPTESYLPILICILHWKQGKELMKIFLHSIDCLFENARAKTKTTEPKLSFEMTLKMLEVLLENPPSLERIRDLPETLRISKALASVTNSIETFITRECDNPNLTISILLSAFRIHCKLLAILALSQNEEVTAASLERLVACLNWARLLPPELAIAADITEIRVTSRRKRKNMRGPPEVPLILPAEMHKFILSLLTELVPLSADLTLTGLRDITALEAACLFNLEVAQVKEFSIFFHNLIKFVYNLVVSFDYEDLLAAFGDIWGYCCQILGFALKYIYNISMTKSLPKQETSLLSQTIEIAVKNIERIKTTGSEESILNNSRVNVHAFIISLSVCVNSVLLDAITTHVISNNLTV